MRRWCLLGLAGCGSHDLRGWWDITRWEVERDGEVLVAKDAGFMLWQDGDYPFTFSTSYRYDPEAFELLPAVPPVTDLAQPTDGTYQSYPEDEPVIFLLWPQRGGFLAQVPLYVTDWTGHSMVLIGDETSESTVRFVMER